MKMSNEAKVISAARSWWKSHRPTFYSRKQHLENPKINTVSGSEKQLAQAVAEFERSKP